VVRSAYGVGTVTLCAVDLRDRPISNWDESSLSELATVLIGVAVPWRQTGVTRNESGSSSSDLNPTGVSDIQTQIVNSVDQFEAVPRPTQWIVLAWIAGLVLVLGPLDYLLVHRVLQRPHWTWVTFPVWVSVVSMWVLNSGTQANTAPLKSRQVDLLDLDATVGVLRGRSWFGFYSPETRRYSVTLQAGFEGLPLQNLDDSYAGWMERAEGSFRGMYRKGSLDLGKPSYSFSEELQKIDNLPVRVWSTGGLEAYWEAPLDSSTPLVESSLTDDGSRRLSGQFTHHLPGELSDWLIAYESFAYFRSSEIGSGQGVLAPGEVFDASTARSNILRGLLVGQTFTVIKGKAEHRDRTVADRNIYDPLSRDPFAILRTLTFHETAGGRSYTGLSNQPLASADLTSLLKLNRAVLFGRLKQPASRFLIDGQTPAVEQQDTFIRIVLPVKRLSRDPSAPPPADLLKPRG
jgi:hypothetical protein